MTNIWTGDRKRQYKSIFFYTHLHFSAFLSGTKVRYRPIKLHSLANISLGTHCRTKTVELKIITLNVSTKNIVYIFLIHCIVLVIPPFTAFSKHSHTSNAKTMRRIRKMYRTFFVENYMTIIVTATVLLYSESQARY